MKTILTFCAISFTLPILFAQPALDIDGTGNIGRLNISDAFQACNAHLTIETASAFSQIDFRQVGNNDTRWLMSASNSVPSLEIIFLPQCGGSSPNVANELFTLRGDNDGRIGINEPNPAARLDVDGSIRIGNNDATATAGMIRWTGTDFEGYDGSSWVSLTGGGSGDIRDCPTGYTAVNDQYCIQTNENSTMTWFNAVAHCVNNDGQMCSWGQWYGACQKAGLSLSNMTEDWEWVDDSNDVEDISGLPPAPIVVGNGDCDERSLASGIAPTRNFRCCFNR